MKDPYVIYEELDQKELNFLMNSSHNLIRNAFESNPNMMLVYLREYIKYLVNCSNRYLQEDMVQRKEWEDDKVPLCGGNEYDSKKVPAFIEKVKKIENFKHELLDVLKEFDLLDK